MFILYQIIGYLAALALIAYGISRGVTSHNRVGAALPAVVGGVLLASAVWLSLWMLGLYGDYLWFASQGFGERFWSVFWTEQSLLAGGALLGAALVLVLVVIARTPLLPSVIGIIVGLVAGASYAESRWDEWILFRHRGAFGVADPAFGRDAGFYVFTLPLLDGIYWLVFASVATGILTVIGGWAYQKYVPRQLQMNPARHRRDAMPYALRDIPIHRHPGLTSRLTLSLTVGVSLLLAIMALGLYLERYELIVSGNSVAGAAGWTDLNVRVPMQTVMAVAFAVAAVWTLSLGLRLRSGMLDPAEAVERFVTRGVVGLAFGYAILLIAAPALLQRVRVSPSEIRVETPYIRHVMNSTRRAFNIDSVDRRSLPMNAPLTPEVAAAHEEMLREIRLWDWRALHQVFGQFHEMRLYYDFADVDIDRYRLDDQYRQVMLAVREINHGDLPAQSQTFVNTRFKYTHGHGAVVAPVSEFSREGREQPIVAGIPPTTTHLALALTQPAIYYGELTNSHVFVHATEPEFRYPAEGGNVEGFYEGEGGVPMSNFLRRLAYAYRFDGTRLMMSQYITPKTRVMFRRNIYERVRALAPFLSYDEDAYPIIHNGRIVWMMDAYTRTNQYPYSERHVFGDRWVNYVRNSVKVTVDAYDGTVRFYVFDSSDPLIRAWRRAFPALFVDGAQMPEGLRAHVRYPERLLRTQGAVYSRYHMEDVTAFYNQEDLWQPATETYYGDARPVQPYYVMWQESPEAPLEFILMWPFTPRNRQVMVGWLAGRSDGEHYGQLLSYHLPKQRAVGGPQQFESAIDQDSELSRLMTLWGTGGSRVLRGNVLSIPIGGTILHVEPIYIEARNSAYPQLQLVAVQNESYLGYGRTLEEALQRMFAQMRAGVPVDSSSGAVDPAAAEGAPARTPQGLARSAHESFERYVELQAKGDFEGAGRELARLRETLRTLAGDQAP